MTPAPVSAFEAYKELKKKKKKKTSFKKEKQSLHLKNPAVAAEIIEMVKSASTSEENMNHELGFKKKKKQSSRKQELKLPPPYETASNPTVCSKLVVKENFQGSTFKEKHPKTEELKLKTSCFKQEESYNEQADFRNPVEAKTRFSVNESSSLNKKTKLNGNGCLKQRAASGEKAGTSYEACAVKIPSKVEGKKLEKKTSKVPEFSTGKSKMAEKNESSQKKAYQKLSLADTLDSIHTANSAFAWMINPVIKEKFFSHYWEKRPVHISRDQNRDYYSTILSSAVIDSVLRSNNLFFGKNVDVTSYSNGVRTTFNPVGRAQAGVVWDFYRNGCSIRLLNPQTYVPELHELNCMLQEFFGSFVGANVYLTPPNSQGFAPHYDDIEAFVLQLEGCKRWQVYAPRCREEKLPRVSSPNFSQEEIGTPILEVTLQEGDLLYFPRGFIHQASTVPEHHSLHVTISTYQRNSWADLLEKVVPAALANAIEEDEDFREGMPLNVLDHLGAIHSDSDSSLRQTYLAKIKKLFSKLFDYAPVDAAADQMGKDFQHDALPPCLSSDERKCSVFENSDHMEGNGKLTGAVCLSANVRIRLTRSKVLRLVSEEDPDTLKLYHCMDNSREYHGEDPQSIEIPVHMGPAIEFLLSSYPDFVPVSALPLDEEEEKMQVAVELWERGLVLTESPLQFVSEDIL